MTKTTKRAREPRSRNRFQRQCKQANCRRVHAGPYDSDDEWILSAVLTTLMTIARYFVGVKLSSIRSAILNAYPVTQIGLYESDDDWIRSAVLKGALCA